MSANGKRTVVLILVVMVLATMILLAVLGRPILWQPTSIALPEHNATPRPAARVFQGEVKLTTNQELQAPIAGTVVAQGATETLPVKADQLILQIDSPQARAQLQQGQARLKAAQAQAAAPVSSSFHDKLQLAQMHLDSTTTMRQQTEKQLAEARALQPAAVQALENATQAEQQATASKQALEQAQAALDAAFKQKGAGKTPPEVQNLQTALEARRQEHVAAQGRMQAAMQAHVQQREEIGKLQRLQGELLGLQRSEKQFAAQLQQLQRSPQAQAASSRDQAVKVAQAQIAAAQALLDRCALKAASNGTLTELRARPGMKVKPGQILAIIQANPEPRLTFHVPAAQAGGLEVGQRAEVTLAGGKAFPAAISQMIHQDDGILMYLQPVDKTALPAVGTALTAQLR